jgi:hypothetical protein
MGTSNQGQVSSPRWITTRRDFIKIGSLGFLGLSLADFFRLRAASGATAVAKERSCIILWLSGGPSHLDLFDPKPEAAEEIRGPFKAIPTNVSGIQISEHLPKTARHADKFHIIRSLTSKEANHERATNYLLTGYLPLPTMEFPSIGSIISKEKGGRNGLPPYVVIPEANASMGSGFLGSAYNPFATSDPNAKNFKVRDVELPLGVTWERMQQRKALLEMVDNKFRALEANPELVKGMDSFYERAYSLMSSPPAKKAFDMEQEPDSVRESYGRTTFGQGCLLARRLIEGGVRFVTVSRGGWDLHRDNFTNLKKNLLPELDQAYSALLADLHQRGLLESTLVVLMGEFGRTPKVNKDAGRDHWSRVFSVCLAGGGVRGGHVLGASDKDGAEVKDRPVEIEDLAVTLYDRFGINPRKEHHTPAGRPIKIVHGGEVIKELV